MVKQVQGVHDARQTCEYKVETGCKINLYLRVLDRMADCYHSLETFFLPVSSPSDTLTIRIQNDASERTAKRNATGLTLSCSDPSIPLDNNTLVKAYALYSQSTGFAPTLALHLQKNIPHGAGLGGGSSNAAGLLLFLNNMQKLYRGTFLTQEEMIGLAAKIGADVPFFLLNQPALATGIGENLVACANPFAGYHILLLCPGIHISTADAFKKLDRMREEKKLFFKNSLTSCPHQANSSLAHGVEIHNDFEEPVFKLYPELFQLKEKLLDEGAEFALLCGSGSSIFGLFKTRKQAQKAEKKLDKIVQKCFISAL